MSEFFWIAWIGAAVQLSVFFAKLYLMRKINRDNKEGKAQIAEMDAILERAQEGNDTIEALTKAMGDLAALHLALRLKAPANYW